MMESRTPRRAPLREPTRSPFEEVNHGSFFGEGLAVIFVEKGVRAKELEEHEVVELLDAISYTLSDSIDLEILCSPEVFEVLLEFSAVTNSAFRILAFAGKLAPSLLLGLSSLEFQFLFNQAGKPDLADSVCEILALLIEVDPDCCRPYFGEILLMDNNQLSASYAQCVAVMSKHLNCERGVDENLFLNRIIAGLCSGRNQSLWAKALKNAIANGNSGLLGKCLQVVPMVCVCVEASDLDTVISAYKVLLYLQREMKVVDRIAVYNEIRDSVLMHLQCSSWRLVRVICPYLLEIAKYYCIDMNVLEQLFTLFTNGMFKEQFVIAPVLTEMFCRMDARVLDVFGEFSYAIFEDLVEFHACLQQESELEKLAVVTAQMNDERMTQIMTEYTSTCHVEVPVCHEFYDTY